MPLSLTKWVESPRNGECCTTSSYYWVGDLMPTKEFMNVRETAKQLGVHENTVRNWEKSGVLRGFKLPGSGFRRFAREDVERMRREMLETYAPATTIPEHTTDVGGTVVDGELI
jgi:excisionase family DNA binding protein